MLADKRKKDQEMAARMKKDKVERLSCRCPMCHGVVALKFLDVHLKTCKR